MVIEIKIVDNGDRLENWERIMFGFFAGGFFTHGLTFFGQMKYPEAYLVLVLFPLLTALCLNMGKFGIWWKEYSTSQPENQGRSDTRG